MCPFNSFRLVRVTIMRSSVPALYSEMYVRARRGKGGWRHEGARRETGGDEKQKKNATPLEAAAAKEVGSQTAGHHQLFTFIIISLARSPSSFCILGFCARPGKLAHQTPLFYGRYTFSFPSVGTTRIS